MRGLWVVVVVVGLSSAYAEPVQPKQDAAAQPKPKLVRAAWKAKRVAPKPAPAPSTAPQPTPKLLYQAAQVHRVKGERAQAIELYEKYLAIAPRGAAANACKHELEKLRDVP